jgi:hypothetical protein
MSIYQEIEAAIVDRLKPFEEAGFLVVALPEVQADYSRPFTNGKITVAYHSSDFKEHNNSLAFISQYEEIRIIVGVQSRKLRDNGGVYDLMGVLRKALIGFEPPECWRMWAKEAGLNEAKLEDGLWTYYAIFCTKTLAVEDYEEDVSQLVKYIQFDNTLTGESSSVGEKVVHVPDPEPEE